MCAEHDPDETAVSLQVARRVEATERQKRHLDDRVADERKVAEGLREERADQVAERRKHEHPGEDPEQSLEAFQSSNSVATGQ